MTDDINPNLEILGALFRCETCLDDIHEWVLHPFVLDVFRLKYSMLDTVYFGEKVTFYLLGIPIVVDRSQNRNPQFIEIVEKAVKKTNGKVESQYLS